MFLEVDTDRDEKKWLMLLDRRGLVGRFQNALSVSTWVIKLKMWMVVVSRRRLRQSRKQLWVLYYLSRWGGGLDHSQTWQKENILYFPMTIEFWFMLLTRASLGWLDQAPGSSRNSNTGTGHGLLIAMRGIFVREQSY